MMPRGTDGQLDAGAALTMRLLLKILLTCCPSHVFWVVTGSTMALL